MLIVEDDTVEREAVARLLAGDEVETIAVATVAEALRRLRESTFDCMVMDLSLADGTGFELLEQMMEHDVGSVPPVIVHTARTLSADDEQRLRRYSRSIIIKGARSPERLLDEVTLFLHQVESRLPPDRQRMLKLARDREQMFDQRRILVVEDDVRNVFALTSILEPRGARVDIARNGREALDRLGALEAAGDKVDLVLMDIMMPEMDGLTAMREIRKRPAWAQLPIIALTAKAMKDDQETCLGRGRQRLPGEAAGPGEAAVAGPHLDGEMTEPAPPPSSRARSSREERDETRELELRLLLEAIFARYHHDFRGYAAASLLRRLDRACDAFGCKTLSALQDRVLHDPESLPRLLRYLTVPVSEMFRDPPSFPLPA